LSDPTGALFIKPCTQTEITFYEAANACYPDLAAFMPTYLGTLSITPPEVVPKEVISVPQKNGTAAMLPPTVLGPLKGRKLNTDMHIVLSNAAASFTKANVLDLKLGARLWDDDSPPEKRARLDSVSNLTTSGSLGFRVAGMRTYQGTAEYPVSEGVQEAAKAGFGELEKENGMFSYNKLYGRQFKSMDVLKGFREFVLIPEAGIDIEQSLGLVEAFLEGTTRLKASLEKTELRMYSASILYIYEGDGNVFAEKYKASKERSSNLQDSETDNNNNDHDHDHDEKEEEEQESDDEDPNVLLSINIIDFAHARFVPGEGPDKNILQGVRSIIELLETLREELNKKAELA
jgi:1D-myo-inositol-tetrakisphosphate 5-kinase/inositol-polyphosphate multikinase